MLRIGVIGGGTYGENHLHVYRDMPGVPTLLVRRRAWIRSTRRADKSVAIDVFI